MAPSRAPDDAWSVGDANIERYDEIFVASRPSVGALSILNTGEIVPFIAFLNVGRDEQQAASKISRFYEAVNVSNNDAVTLTDTLLARLRRDGWMRDVFPLREESPLVSIYFTLTRSCDRSCPYCYQGLANRNNTYMMLDHAFAAVNAIHKVNPDCEFIFTGGEPFMHPRALDVMTLAELLGHSFTVLSNGSFVDDRLADNLASFKRLRYVQLSLDGIKENTHAKTRGKGHLGLVMNALHRLIERSIPFVLAPTMHHENLDEVYEIAYLAISNGGWCKPNILHRLPHKGLDFTSVQLNDSRCWQALIDINRKLVEEFGLDRLSVIGNHYKGREVCATMEPNTHSICGMGFSLLDLDWNGDVYPCHLTKSPELVLGNLFNGDSFEEMFRRARERNVRVRSHEIPKCSGCKFVSNCGGGCRANAWFEYGSLAREDSQCSLNYASQLNKALLRVEN